MDLLESALRDRHKPEEGATPGSLVKAADFALGGITDEEASGIMEIKVQGYPALEMRGASSFSCFACTHSELLFWYNAVFIWGLLDLKWFLPVLK